MSRLTILVCAALIASAGCTLDSLFVSFIGPDRKEQSFVGTLDQTEARLALTLERMNIRASKQVHGEEVRLMARSPKGSAFALVLQQQKDDNGPRTLVGIEWSKEADEQFWLILVRALLTPPPTQPLPPIRTSTPGLPPG